MSEHFDTEELEVTFELQMADVEALGLHHLQHSRAGRQTRWILQGFLILVCLAFAASRLLSTGPDQRWAFSSLLMAFGPLLLVLVYLATLFPRMQRWQIGRMMRQAYRHDPQGLIGEHRLVLTDAGISHHGKLGTSQIGWEAIRSVVATDEHIFLSTGPVTALVMPRRAFADVASFQAFESFARRRVP